MAQRSTDARKTSVELETATWSASPWRRAQIYLRRGVAMVGHGLGVHLQVVAIFVAPALLAAYLSATASEPLLWQQLAMACLPWVTALLGAVVVMIVVTHQAHGRSIGIGKATRQALPWLPRYLWTNVHTSVIFWTPVGLLLVVRNYQPVVSPVLDQEPALSVLWWGFIGAIALCLHTRTLLAPFLALHSDLPGTLAALEAWRLSGRHFRVCIATFLLATLPVGLPLALLTVVLCLTLPAGGLAVFFAAAPNLVWAAIQANRPLLIPAIYALYQDLWRIERERRQREGQPATPPLARALLAITRPLPKFGKSTL